MFSCVDIIEGFWCWFIVIFSPDSGHRFKEKIDMALNITNIECIRDGKRVSVRKSTIETDTD